LSKSIEQKSDNPFAYLALGDAYEKKSEIENAISTYQDLSKLGLDIHGLKEKINYLKSLIAEDPDQFAQPDKKKKNKSPGLKSLELKPTDKKKSVERKK
jgi:hypothetical protein